MRRQRRIVNAADMIEKLQRCKAVQCSWILWESLLDAHLNQPQTVADSRPCWQDEGRLGGKLSIVVAIVACRSSRFRRLDYACE